MLCCLFYFRFSALCENGEVIVAVAVRRLLRYYHVLLCPELSDRTHVFGIAFPVSALSPENYGTACSPVGCYCLYYDAAGSSVCLCTAIPHRSHSLSRIYDRTHFRQSYGGAFPFHAVAKYGAQPEDDTDLQYLSHGFCR